MVYNSASNLLSRFAQFRENFSVEVVADPESGIPDQVVQDWLYQFNQSSPLGIGQDTKQTGDPQPRCLGRPSSASFVHEQQFRLTLYCKDDCLGLTCVKSVKQLSDTILVFRNLDDQPRDGVNIDRWDNAGLSGQFRGHRWRNEYLPIQCAKNIQATYPCEI